MRRLSITLACLTSIACVPPADDAGEIDATEGAGDPTGDNSASEPAPVEATAEDGGWAYIWPMIRSADGVVLAARADPSIPGSSIVELSTTLETSWSIDLPDATIAQISVLPDGGYVVAGFRWTGEIQVATAWRLSCCGEVELEVQFPSEDGQGNLGVAAVPHMGGILLALNPEYEAAPEPPQSILMLTDLDFVEQWSAPFYAVAQAVIGPTGNIVATVSRSGPALAEVTSPDGQGFSVTSLDRRTWLVGSGDDLLLVSTAVDQLDVAPYGTTSALAVEIAGLGTEGVLIDRRDRIACAFTVRHAPDAPDELRIVEFDEAGVVARDMAIAPMTGPYVEVTAVAVGEDDAIYVATSEDSSDGMGAGYVRRIAPL